MAISKYEVLLKTIELSSITKAAAELGYTQPGITHIINNLEEELGIKILNRNRSGIQLTLEGELILPCIEALHNAELYVAKRAAEIRDANITVVKVGATTGISTHIIPSLFSRFSERFPDISLHLCPGTNEEIESLLMKGEIDCGFILFPTSISATTYSFIEDPICVIMPYGHPLEKYQIVPQELLLDFPYVRFKDGQHRDFESITVYKELLAKATCTSNDDYSVMALVEKGFGISLMPSLMMRKAPYSISQRLLDPPVTRSICLAITQKEADISEPSMKFIQFVNETKDSLFL